MALSIRSSSNKKITGCLIIRFPEYRDDPLPMILNLNIPIIYSQYLFKAVKYLSYVL